MVRERVYCIVVQLSGTCDQCVALTASFEYKHGCTYVHTHPFMCMWCVLLGAGIRG